MRRCELCESAARMYCESDQASLCWDCDAKVHSANFLVARHSRSLLCHACQSPTAWSASGARLGPTVSICERCVDGVKDGGGTEGETEGEIGDEFDAGDHECEDDNDGDECDEDDDEEEEEEVEGDEDGDNQVVPWSSTPPPPAASSTSSEDSSSRLCDDKGACSGKRLHEDAVDCLSDDDDLDCSSSGRRNTLRLPEPASAERESEAAIVDSCRTLKRQRIDSNRSITVHRRPAGSRTAVVVESLKSFHDRDVSSGDNASSAIFDICKLSKNPGPLDLDLSKSP